MSAKLRAQGYDICIMQMRVECLVGFRGEQEPLAFWLGERRMVVNAIVDRWLSPDLRYFKCAVDGGDSYILRFNRDSGDWDLAAFTDAKRQTSYGCDRGVTIN
ncbi:MAG: hypothetical protein EXR39_17965 [Betaproteobacteria bacterium]|nr:hypothetical protein [Betaproteobacteria bacterium]